MFAMLALGWFWFTGATFLTLIFPVTKFSLYASEDVALVLLTAFSVGVAVGALIYSAIVKGEVTLRTAPWGAVGMGVGAILFYLSVSFYGEGPAEGAPLLTVSEFLARGDAWPVLASLVMIAMFAGLYVTPLNVEYQVKSPDGRKGQFVACSNVIDSLAMSGSAAFAGVLIGVLGAPRELVFVIVGLTGFVAAWVIRRRALQAG